MDRISALRNVEDALADFENGDIDLATLERDVRGVLRTYATDFDGELSAYRAEGENGADGGSTVDGIVVLAASRDAARDRIRDIVDDPGRFTVEAVDDP